LRQKALALILQLSVKCQDAGLTKLKLEDVSTDDLKRKAGQLLEAIRERETKQLNVIESSSEPTEDLP
jgi:hypothetical protein